jgi:hypothetical protein
LIRGKKVIVFTPYGRELTASILYRYLKRDFEAGVIDEWQLWQNTDEDQVSDREYATKLAAENEWIKEIPYPEEAGPRAYPKQLNTGRFYHKVAEQDPDAIFVRMDDDIVWIDQHAIKNLVNYRLDNPFPFVVFPLIWNNATCSYYLQQGEQMPSWWGVVKTSYCMDPIGWADPHFAASIHGHLLDMIETKQIPRLFMHTSIQLPMGHQFSVSCFAQKASEYLEGVPGEEEAWHTITMPYEKGRPNAIVPDALISHFSFFHQREYLLKNTDLLDRYRALAEAL